MKAFILAAGKGTRLQDLTRNCPKPMLPIQGRPLLDYLVAWIRGYGITDIAMNLHHCPEVITNYFGNGKRMGVSIIYSYEQELLGTAGAAKKLQKFLNEPFIVVYGDVYTNLDLSRLIRFHQQQESTSTVLATLALYQVPNPTECGLVELNKAGRVLRFVEKPPPNQVFTDLANAGIMVCDPTVLEWTPPETVYDFGRDLFPHLLTTGAGLFGQAITLDEFVLDIGTPTGYQRAQQICANNS